MRVSARGSTRAGRRSSGRTSRRATVRPPSDAAAEVAEALGHLQAFGLRPIGELRTRIVEEADWADAWKAYFPVMRVGRRLVIRPTWRRHRRAPDDVVLALDPGMAFGTGLHPTTRLCLAGVEALADRGVLADARVLDVGCGSGILAIAALKLGAATALGLDTDPIAIEATIANARRNALVRRVRARQGSLPSGEPAFDVVLANLIAGLLVPLADGLRGELRPGGVLLASGIFVDREGDVRDAFDDRRSRRDRPDRGGGLGRAGGRPSGLTRVRPYNRGDAHVLPGPARGAHHPGGEPRPAVDPASVRAADPARGGRVGERRRPVAAVGPDARHDRHRDRVGADRDRPRR